MQPWIGFSLLTGVELAAAFGCWWRRGECSFRPLLSCQWKHLFKIYWHYLSWITTQMQQPVLLLKTQLLSPADIPTYILIRAVAALSPELTVQVFLPCRGRSNKKKKILICLSMDRDFSWVFPGGFSARSSWELGPNSAAGSLATSKPPATWEENQGR